MAPPTDESGFLSEEEFLTGIAKPKPPKVGEPREPIKVEGGQSEEEFLAEVDTPKPKVEAPRPELFDPVEAAGGWDAFQEAQDKLAVEAPEEVPEEGPHKQVSEEEAYQSGWITRHQATVEEPNHRELTSIGFAQTVDTATGELLPIYDEQALITLRAEREASFQEAVKERREGSFTERLARVGDVDDRGGRSADFLAKKLNEWFGSIRADWAREAAIKEQAKEQGFDSLSQEDVEWMEENEPEELEFLHALSKDPEKEVMEEEAVYLQSALKEGFDWMDWESELYNEDSPIGRDPDPERWSGRDWNDLTRDEARQRFLERLGYTPDEAYLTLGRKDSRIAEIREKKREAIKDRKEKTVEIWQEITQDEKADLHRLVKDTKIVDYIDDKGRVDFQAYEDAIVPKLAEEMIAEDLGENIHFLSPELSPAMRNYYLNKAEQKWYLQKKMILSVGKGGLPFFDVDAKRTNKKIVEALKGLDKAPDMLLRDIPALAETAESLGIENWALYQVTDPLLALTIVGAPIAAMSLIPKELTGGYQMSGTKALAEGIRYNPLTLPIISATTPSYAMDFSPTHQQMVGRTMLDSLNAWFVTTWIAAAQRTNADIIAGEGGVPRSAESMEYSDAFFEAFTADGITKASESQLPAIYAAARAGDEKAIGWGLAKYILSRDPVFGRIAMAPKAALGALSMVADTYVRAIGATGDDINTELAIRNLRQGNMLFMVHDQLSNDFCDALELDKHSELRNIVRRTHMATGLVAEFTPVTGADPLTASIGVMGSTVRKVRGTRSFLQKSAEKLRKIRLRDDLTYEQKLAEIDRLDPAIGRMVRENVRVEAEYSGQTVRFLQDQERVLDQALELAEQTAREAGLESSPAVLAGSKFRNKGYADRYVEVEVRRATKEPGVLAEAAGRAPPKKSFQEEFGEIEDIVLQLEAEGVTLPLGFRTWDQGRQEAYIWELRKTQIGEAVRARAEARVALDLEQAGERIGRTTVTGDVYRVEGQAYMRIGAEGPDAVWVPVREADIPKMRELAVDEALTTHTPLRPVEWKSALTGEWVSRPRGAMETPWGEVALARQEVDSEIRGIRAAISSEKKAGRDALIGDLQDQLIAAKARAKELEAQEIALRKTFPDYEVPDPRLREAPTELDEGAIQFYEAKRQNMLDYWNRRLRGSEEALTKATKAQDAEAQELAEAAVARYREEIRIVTAKTPIKIRDDIYQLLGNPAVWRTNTEMIGGTAVSVRKPVVGPTSKGTEEALRAEADVILQEYGLAQAELRTLEREYAELMAGEGSAYEVATGLERLLAQNAKEVRRLEKRVAKLEEKLAPRLEEGGKLKHQVDLAEAKLGHKKAKWQKDKNLFNRRAMKSAEKEVEAAHAKLEKFARKEMFPLEAEIKSLNKEIAAQANARIVYESQLLGSKAGGPGLRQYLPTDDQRAIGIFKKRVERNVKRAERKVAELERAYLAKSKEARIEGNAQLKALSRMVQENMRASTASEKLSVFDRVLSRLAKDIDEGTQAIKRIPKAQEAFNEALEKATVSFAEKGGRELDVELFVGRMEATFTRPALERAAELGGEGSRLIRKLLDEADANRVLREAGIEAPTRVNPGAPDALPGKVILESGRSEKVVEALADIVRPGHGYFTHSIGGPPQRIRIQKAGGIEGVSHGISEHGIMFKQYDNGMLHPFVHYIGHATGPGQGRTLGERLLQMARKEDGAQTATSKWIAESPVTFIVEMPLKAGTPARVAGRDAYHTVDTIMANAKPLNSPGMEKARLAADNLEKAKKGSGKHTHLIPSEHIKGVLVNGEIISLAQYMGRFQSAKATSLSLRESMVIQQILPHLSRGWKLNHASSRGINIVEAIKIAQRDPDLSINSWRRLMESTAQTRLKDMFDPIRQEIGEVSSRVAQVVKGVEHLQDHLRDELYMLGMHIESMARKNNWTMTQRFDNHQRMVLQYLTEAEGLAIYRTRSTYFNTGDSSIWEQALWQLKNDPRTLGKSRLIEMAKAEQGIMKRQVAKGDLPADTTIPTVEKLMERRWGKGVLELADEGDGAVARALSRLFLPQGKWGGLSSMKSRKLYEATLDAFHASDNLAEVLLRIEEATLKLKFEAYPNKVEALQRAAFALGHAAIENRANHMFTRAITGRITPDQASDIRRLMDHTPEEIKDYEGALEALNRIGMPFTARRVKMREFGPTRAANTERDLKILATGADDQGQTFFMPQQVAEKIASTMPKVTKEATERFVESRGTWDMLKTGAEFEALSLWKTSVVTGIVIPRPTYFWNNFIGDLSQVWLNQGFNTAVRMNANLVHTISLNSLEAIHPAIRKRLSRMETHNIEKYGPDRAQGSIWNAMFNPVANRVWRGENGVLRTAGGREYSYQQLRRIMEEEGILDTMIHAELLDTWHRLTPDRWKNMPVLGKAAEGVEGSRHAISSFATFVQQRQRGNLFLDLVRRGKTPQEAGKLVRESLYDWKHGLAQWEVATIGRVSPFYRFWKLAFRQTAAAILDPMVSMERGMMRSLTGQTGLKRIHQQWATSQAWPHMWNPEEYSAYQDMAEKYDAAARYLRPSWARMRAVSFVRKNELDRINHLQSLRGKAMGYSMSVMPPMTALDLTELMGCLSFGMLFAGLDDSDLAPWGGKVPGDAESRFWGPILDLVFPHVGEPLEQYLLDRGVDTGGFPLGKRRRISESQKFILDTIGVGTWRGQAIGGAMGAVVGAGKARGGAVPGTTKILGHAALGAAVMSFPAGEAGYHPEYHYPEADAGTVAYLEKIPFFGTELPALLDAAWFKNTKMQQAWHSDRSGFGDYLDGMGKFVSTFSGMAKEVPFSPEDTKKFRRRGYQKQIRDSAAEAGIEDALRARERDPKIKIKSLRQRVMEEDLKQRLQEREDREK